MDIKRYTDPHRMPLARPCHPGDVAIGDEFMVLFPNGCWTKVTDSALLVINPQTSAVCGYTYWQVWQGEYHPDRYGAVKWARIHSRPR